MEQEHFDSVYINQLTQGMASLSMFEARRRNAEESRLSRIDRLLETTRYAIYEQGQSSCNDMADGDQQEQAQSVSQQLGEEDNQSQSHLQNKRKRQKNYSFANRFTVFDWLVSVPTNFIDYFVSPKPDGNRVMVEVRGFKLQVKDRFGTALIKTQISTKLDGSVFEGFYVESQNTVYINDLLEWRKSIMATMEFTMRQSWLRSNLRGASILANDKCSFKLMPYEPNRAETLKKVYESVYQFPRDGIMFVHKDSLYEPGLNPLILIWKDPFTSKYSLLTVEEQNQGLIKGVGKIQDNWLLTADNVPLFNFQNTPCGRFARFTTKGFDTTPVIVPRSIMVEKTMEHYGKDCADSISKLLFKQQPLRFAQLFQGFGVTNKIQLF